MERLIQIPSFDEFTEIRLGTLYSSTLHVPKGGRIFMDSLGPCLGVVGYDFRHKIIFGSHMVIDPGIDEEIKKYLRILKQSGIKHTRVAVAGGNLDFTLPRGYPYYFQKLIEVKYRLQRMPGIINYITPEKVASIYRSDQLDVVYQKGRFRINYEKGNVGEPGLEPGTGRV